MKIFRLTPQFPSTYRYAHKTEDEKEIAKTPAAVKINVENKKLPAPHSMARYVQNECEWGAKRYKNNSSKNRKI